MPKASRIRRARTNSVWTGGWNATHQGWRGEACACGTQASRKRPVRGLRRGACGRRQLLAEPRALDEAAVARLADELATLDDHLPAHEHDLRGAGDLGPLVEVVVHIRVAALGRERHALVGVEEND